MPAWWLLLASPATALAIRAMRGTKLRPPPVVSTAEEGSERRTWDGAKDRIKPGYASHSSKEDCEAFKNRMRIDPMTDPVCCWSWQAYLVGAAAREMHTLKQAFEALRRAHVKFRKIELNAIGPDSPDIDLLFPEVESIRTDLRNALAAIELAETQTKNARGPRRGAGRPDVGNLKRRGTPSFVARLKRQSLWEDSRTKTANYGDLAFIYTLDTLWAGAGRKKLGGPHSGASCACIRHPAAGTDPRTGRSGAGRSRSWTSPAVLSRAPRLSRM